jgi:steroid 5-alpha reductase family enzyme
MAALLFGLFFLLIYMSGLFVVAFIRKNNGTADIGYGIAFIVLIAAVTFASAPVTLQVLVLATLPLIWGLRLATRIFYKNLGKPEDFRYKAWREAWGKTFFVRSFLQVYMLQGLVVFFVALPVTLSLAYPIATVDLRFMVVGILLWLVGFFFEVVGDSQLDTFIKNPANKGKIMTIGLWKYSRHPNYFGESVMWWGIALASFGLTILPFLGLIGPTLITFLLLKVSGVPLLEKHFEGNPEWEVYKARTSVFFPLPPKK